MGSYLIEASFVDAAHELPKDTARKVWKALSLLSKNPSHQGLHLETLRGRAEGLQSVRVDDQYRIILQPGENVPRLLYVGPHHKAYQFAQGGTKIDPVLGEFEKKLTKEGREKDFFVIHVQLKTRSPRDCRRGAVMGLEQATVREIVEKAVPHRWGFRNSSEVLSGHRRSCRGG